MFPAACHFSAVPNLKLRLLVSSTVLDLLKVPSYALLGPVKVHDDLVVLAQGRPVANGQHGDAGIHAGLVQNLLTIC